MGSKHATDSDDVLLTWASRTAGGKNRWRVGGGRGRRRHVGPCLCFSVWMRTRRLVFGNFGTGSNGMTRPCAFAPNWGQGCSISSYKKKRLLHQPGSSLINVGSSYSNLLDCLFSKLGMNADACIYTSTFILMNMLRTQP